MSTLLRAKKSIFKTSFMFVLASKKAFLENQNVPKLSQNETLAKFILYISMTKLSIF